MDAGVLRMKSRMSHTQLLQNILRRHNRFNFSLVGDHRFVSTKSIFPFKSVYANIHRQRRLVKWECRGNWLSGKHKHRGSSSGNCAQGSTWPRRSQVALCPAWRTLSALTSKAELINMITTSLKTPLILVTTCLSRHPPDSNTRHTKPTQAGWKTVSLPRAISAMRFK